MTKTALRWLERSLTVAAAATLLAGCADDVTLAPGPRFALASRLGAQRSTAQIGVAASVERGVAAAKLPGESREVNLGTCDSLRVPPASKLAFHAYASGVQVYRWSGTSWVFVEPSAHLFADAEGRGTVGTHYAGPTWQSVSGGKVVGTVLKRCTPDANAIPWLLLRAVADSGPGVFQRTKFIQRVNTVGGNAPAAPATLTGDVARVPYTAEYLFYREQ
jgi:hypothetical protein